MNKRKIEFLTELTKLLIDFGVKFKYENSEFKVYTYDSPDNSYVSINKNGELKLKTPCPTDICDFYCAFSEIISKYIVYLEIYDEDNIHYLDFNMIVDEDYDLENIEEYERLCYVEISNRGAKLIQTL